MSSACTANRVTGSVKPVSKRKKAFPFLVTPRSKVPCEGGACAGADGRSGRIVSIPQPSQGEGHAQAQEGERAGHRGDRLRNAPVSRKFCR